MRTYLEGALFSDFIEKQPKQIPFGTHEDNVTWNSFWQFCKEETDLHICNLENIKSKDKLYLTQLTTGRGDTKLNFEEGYNFHYKEKVKNGIPTGIFYLNENDPLKKDRFKRQNGRLMGFQDDYFHLWEKFRLLEVETICPIRKDSEHCLFYNWDQLNDYLVPFSDVVLIDNYIFSDKSLIPSNFEQILLQLCKATPVSFNLTIITYEGASSKQSIKQLYTMIKELENRHKLSFKLELLLTNSFLKEHDRNIITNYVRIKSGDSFNFFNSKGDVITKGTEIEFHSMAEWKTRNAVKAILNSIIKIRKRLSMEIPATRIAGQNGNRLLSE